MRCGSLYPRTVRAVEHHSWSLPLLGPRLNLSQGNSLGEQQQHARAGQLAEIASQEGMWLHIDAAWGGAAVLVPELRSAFDGIERLNQIEIWLGMITRDLHPPWRVRLGVGFGAQNHDLHLVL